MNRPAEMTGPRAESVAFRWRLGFALAVLIAAAFWLRLADLGARPMHADEANQAVRLGQLLETGHYVFEAREHGPTLYYFALLPAWLCGQTTLAALTETTVRLTPALFGGAAVLLLYLLARPLGRGAALGAAALFALAPPAVYYSRYFIQETLLVTFTLATLVCAYRWWTSGGRLWAAGGGACVGLMVATKATTPVLVAAALGGVLLSGQWRRLVELGRDAKALAAGGGAALLVWMAFYSSFGANLPGCRDALVTYAAMLHRAVGGETGHEKPWWYYGSLFVFQRRGGLVWDQSVFLLLSAVGAAVAWRRCHYAHSWLVSF